jgi:hypothetical protein
MRVPAFLVGELHLWKQNAVNFAGEMGQFWILDFGLKNWELGIGNGNG